MTGMGICGGSIWRRRAGTGDASPMVARKSSALSICAAGRPRRCRLEPGRAYRGTRVAARAYSGPQRARRWLPMPVRR